MGISQRLYTALIAIAAVVWLLVLTAPSVSLHYAAVVCGLTSAIVLFALVKHSIASPINALLVAADKYAKGNFAFRLDCDRSDEFGVLLRSFNDMGEELQRYSDQLSTEVLQRKQAEHSARESRDYLESALSQCPSGIVIVSAADHTIQFANRVALTLLGKSADGLSEVAVPMPLEDRVFHRSEGSDGTPTPTPLKRALCDGETVRDEEYIVRGPCGEVIWVNLSVSPIRSDSGEIITATLVLNDVSERRRLIEKLRSTALRDPLTELPNRTSILQSIQEAIDSPNGSPFAILFMDFDRFKLINDSLGHDVGDELLRQIAARIQYTVRNTDGVGVPARLGGDEFVVFLKDLPNLNVVETIAERLLEEMSKGFDLNGQKVCSTASIGVVTSEHQFASAADMLRDADLAMYKSKAEGKGRYTVFDRSLRDEIQQRLNLENDMRSGISRNEFALDFQPIVSLETGEVVAAESLARWKHPTRGILEATDFISVANETGLIVPIGDRFVSDACRALARWRLAAAAQRRFSVHVKVSRLQLLLPNLVSVVEDSLADHRIPPRCLLLTVTEQSMMSDPDRVIRRMNALREIGIKVGVDGFGTGVSSLGCLHEFPIDVLKLDREFIGKMFQKSESLAILNAILNLADELDVQVVASGVENVDQLGLLKRLRCRYAQGFLFAEPMCLEQIGGVIGTRFDVSDLPVDVSSHANPSEHEHSFSNRLADLHLQNRGRS